MINIDCVITEGGTINAIISKDLEINVDIISSGPQGEQGIQGERGYSAYKQWLDLGNVGTINDFISSLKGDKGQQGIQGVQGIQGETGGRGTDGVITEISGQYAFQIKPDGNLYVLYPDDGMPPNYSINQDGYLVLAL